MMAKNGGISHSGNVTTNSTRQTTVVMTECPRLPYQEPPRRISSDAYCRRVSSLITEGIESVAISNKMVTTINGIAMITMKNAAITACSDEKPMESKSRYMADVNAQPSSQSRAAPVSVCQKNHRTPPHATVATANGMNVSHNILGCKAFASARTNERNKSFMQKWSEE